MRRFLGLVLVAIIVVASGFASTRINEGAFERRARTGRPKQIRHFTSRQELKAFLKRLQKKRRGTGQGVGSGNGDGMAADSQPVGAASETVNVTASASTRSEAQESITNVQTEGVDEGGIVKLHGNYLIVLRRGRLFTVDISSGGLRKVSSIDAYSPDIQLEGGWGTWYDEMLVSGNNLLVIGYSYDRGGTEIGLFGIDDAGGLTYRSTYHLRSNDYYSSRNYASRLIGNKLIFYSPLNVDLDEEDPFDSFPAIRRWHKDAKPAEFREIAKASRVYLPEGFKPEDDLTLHTVTTCDIRDTELKCEAESVMGPSGNEFYVSARNIYVWASQWWEDDRRKDASLLFKIPLNGAGPSAIRASGGPVDQFSFHEDEDENLSVLVQSMSDGEGSWYSRVKEGDLALLRVTASDFADGSSAVFRSSYQPLLRPAGWGLQNRFIGDHLLYGSGGYLNDDEDEEAQKKLFVVGRSSRVVSALRLEHNVERLDLLGQDGIVVGSQKDDLYFTSVQLDGSPRVISSYALKNAGQGESRSQGFFYKPENSASGIVGLPVIRRDSSASIIFLRNDRLQLRGSGELTSANSHTEDDKCKVSCVDWYGNARPIFAKGRVFALMGYEIVEGSVVADSIREIRRLDFGPVGAGNSDR